MPTAPSTSSCWGPPPVQALPRPSCLSPQPFRLLDHPAWQLSALSSEPPATVGEDNHRCIDIILYLILDNPGLEQVLIGVAAFELLCQFLGFLHEGGSRFRRQVRQRLAVLDQDTIQANWLAELQIII